MDSASMDPAGIADFIASSVRFCVPILCAVTNNFIQVQTKNKGIAICLQLAPLIPEKQIHYALLF